MAYKNNIPNAGDILSLSQAEIKENFSQLEIQFSIDHSSLLPAVADGKHVQVTLPQFTTITAPTTAVGEGALYVKDNGTQPEAYFREESDGDQVELTRNGNVNSGIRAFALFTNTGTRIGDSLNISTDAVPATRNYTITFTTPLPNANYVILGSVTQTPGNVGRFMTVVSQTVNSFEILISGTSYGNFHVAVLQV